MQNAFAILAVAVGLASVAYAWRNVQLRQAGRARLFDPQDDDLDAATDDTMPAVRPFVRQHRFLPIIAGVAVGAALYLTAGLSEPFAVAVGLIVVILGTQFEYLRILRRHALVEAQLADGIDLMVGALGAGAGATAAIESALHETRRPLRPLLADVLGRIRYGDDPQVVFRALTERVPLEPFLLFSSTLAVHWEVGGSLAPTLATVGRTIRDRIEISRKIRSNIIQTQLSVLAVLAVTYFMAAVMWRTNPEQMLDFLRSPTAQWFIAATIVLQAVGIGWMSNISRMRY